MIMWQSLSYKILTCTSLFQALSDQIVQYLVQGTSRCQFYKAFSFVTDTAAK